MECYLVQNGGSNPLNFKVICNPQPETAKENTIWVDTDRINNYYFCATQPENMVEYDVWFPTGTYSTGLFNALKKNGIQVYPISAKQMVSGVLVDKTAKSYQGGAWAEWIAYLFHNGNSYTDLTGGWVDAQQINASYAGKYPIALSNVIKLHTPAVAGYRQSVAMTAKSIDTTGFTALEVDCSKFALNDTMQLSDVRLLSTNAANWGDYTVARTEIKAAGTISVSIDTPGRYYVALCILAADYACENTIEVSSVRLVK